MEWSNGIPASFLHQVVSADIRLQILSQAPFREHAQRIQRMEMASGRNGKKRNAGTIRKMKLLNENITFLQHILPNFPQFARWGENSNLHAYQYFLLLSEGVQEKRVLPSSFPSIFRLL
jgi:hypothetical protein